MSDRIIPGLDASYHPGKGWVVDKRWAREQVLLSEEKRRAKKSGDLDEGETLPLPPSAS